MARTPRAPHTASRAYSNSSSGSRAGSQEDIVMGTTTPDLDAMERRVPDEDCATYPPTSSEEPDDATALLGGGRRRRPKVRDWAEKGQRLGRRVLDIKVPVGRCQIPIVLPITSILLLFLLFLLRRASSSSFTPLPLLSNGTHTFHPTTIVISLDGFRPSYLFTHTAQLPNLLTLAAEGVSAEMTPVFPTLTFPNHWSILTGLYPSSHGILANQFYRPGEGEFDYGSPDTSWAGHWWRGEPMWSLAERNGRKALQFMWPGPPTTSAGISPSFFVPYAKWNTTVKYDKLIHYLDMPVDTAPSLLFMYLPDVDQAGHRGGPESAKVSDALERVDTFVGDLRAEITKRNLGKIVDLVVLSDHGMAKLSKDRLLFFEDIMGDLHKDIAHKDGWPSYGLWFKDGVDWKPHLAALEESAKTKQFSVYTHGTMPERWRFAYADHIAPIYLVPDLGWLITDHEEYDDHGLGVLGAHGYDNQYDEMHAVFFTDGPAAERMKAHTKGNDAGWRSHEPAVMEPFNNLEVFGLVSRLQQLKDAKPNNGTEGFWDTYLGKE